MSHVWSKENFFLAVYYQVDPYEAFNSYFGQSSKFFGDDIDPGGFIFGSKLKRNPRMDIR